MLRRAPHNWRGLGRWAGVGGLGLAVCTWAWAGGPGLTPQAEVTIDAERLEYDQAGQKAHTEGATQVRVEVPGDLAARLLAETGSAEADLARQEVRAPASVDLTAPGAWLHGEDLRLNLQTREFRLQAPQAVLNLAPSPDRPPVLGQLRGEEVSAVGDYWRLRGAALSPGTEARPPLSLRARELEYSSTRGLLHLRGGSLNFLGVNLPFPLDVRTRVGPHRAGELRLPLPTYSKRTGVTLPLYYQFTAEDDPLQSEVALRLGTRRGIGVLSETRYAPGRWSFGLDLAHRQQVTTQLNRDLFLDRLPLLLVEGWQDSSEQDRGWRVRASTGSFVERDEADESANRVSSWRSELVLGYGWGRADRRARLGEWADLSVRGDRYGQGKDYLDGALEIGAGLRLGARGKASLTLIHHLVSGETPFEFDRVDIRSEVRPAADLRLFGPWGIRSEGRYDLEEERFRDYYLELNYRTNALTWGLYWSAASDSLGLRVDINGLTGDTDPPEITGPLGEQYLQAQQRLEAAFASPAP